jgi:hypothetical protein
VDNILEAIWYFFKKILVVLVALPADELHLQNDSVLNCAQKSCLYKAGKSKEYFFIFKIPWDQGDKFSLINPDTKICSHGFENTKLVNICCDKNCCEKS